MGGGGGNAVAHMVNSGVEGVEFITANTDSQAIKNCGANLQLTLGCNVTKGLGVGANPEVGRQAALEDREAIKWDALQGRTWCSSPPAWAAVPAPARRRWWRSWPRRWAS
ncbi:hypothetical protein LJB71_15060 [Thermomonas sp. S9]|nr:hypothetical protein [Thermomonas sp. S9]